MSFTSVLVAIVLVFPQMGTIWTNASHHYSYSKGRIVLWDSKAFFEFSRFSCVSNFFSFHLLCKHESSFNHFNNSHIITLVVRADSLVAIPAFPSSNSFCISHDVLHALWHFPRFDRLSFTATSDIWTCAGLLCFFRSGILLSTSPLCFGFPSTSFFQWWLPHRLQEEALWTSTSKYQSWFPVFVSRRNIPSSNQFFIVVNYSTCCRSPTVYHCCCS